VSNPAPKAPSAPPLERTSHGPGCGGSAFLKSFSESAQKRASGMPEIVAPASSAAVNGSRGGNSDDLGATGGGF
jgi:hypothetical protein